MKMPVLPLTSKSQERSAVAATQPAHPLILVCIANETRSQSNCQPAESKSKSLKRRNKYCSSQSQTTDERNECLILTVASCVFIQPVIARFIYTPSVGLPTFFIFIRMCKYKNDYRKKAWKNITTIALKCAQKTTQRRRNQWKEKKYEFELILNEYRTDRRHHRHRGLSIILAICLE